MPTYLLALPQCLRVNEIPDRIRNNSLFDSQVFWFIKETNRVHIELHIRML